jgi:hypothetical protein
MSYDEIDDLTWLFSNSEFETDRKKLWSVVETSKTEEQLNAALEMARLFVTKHGRGEYFVEMICDLLRTLRNE